MTLDWTLYPNFTEAEFICRCGCGRADMDSGFMDRLQSLRHLCRFAFVIRSGFRCEAYNGVLYGVRSKKGPHTLGKAADVAAYWERAFKIVGGAHKAEITGLGIDQRLSIDKQSRFIHLDTLTPKEAHALGAKRPNVWGY